MQGQKLKLDHLPLPPLPTSIVEVVVVKPVVVEAIVEAVVEAVVVASIQRIPNCSIKKMLYGRKS